MGPIHTPRMLFAIGKGLARRRSAGTAASTAGLGADNPYVSAGRVGIFDMDYLMHMNNAAYLSHAEYARWEMCAANGLLSSMLNNKVNFLVGGTAIRFRREISPIFRKFEVHSSVARLDERYMWIYHAFRYPADGKDPGRIRAHAVCQGVAIQGKAVLDPRTYLKDMVGMDADVVDSISSDTASSDGGKETSQEDIFAELMDKYSSMEEVFKKATAKDDEELANKSKKP